MSRIDFVTGAPEKYADLVDALAVIPGRYHAALDGVRDAVMQQTPPEGWSPQRVLAHVAFVAEANEVFIYQMATMTDPARKPFPSGYEATDLEELPAIDLLRRIEEAVGHTVALLSGTPDAAWGRPGYARGLRRSLRQQVVLHAEHFDEHLAEMQRLIGVATTANAR
ncbi:MAG: DinB family protein [Dehalococcoidia bacterium]|nr:DinB family protein [Dehalococcoidia bacterium]